jgi:hypothetical protein
MSSVRDIGTDKRRLKKERQNDSDTHKEEEQNINTNIETEKHLQRMDKQTSS